MTLTTSCIHEPRFIGRLFELIEHVFLEEKWTFIVVTQHLNWHGEGTTMNSGLNFEIKNRKHSFCPKDSGRNRATDGERFTDRHLANENEKTPLGINYNKFIECLISTLNV